MLSLQSKNRYSLRLWGLDSLSDFDGLTKYIIAKSQKNVIKITKD